MLRGMRRLYHKSPGLTLVEVLLSTLLLAVIFLAVSSLHVAHQKFYFSSSDKAMIGQELGYAIQHIYEHVMMGKGDPASQPIVMFGDSEFTLEYIDKFTSAQKKGRYRISDGKLEFDEEDDGIFDESLCQKVTIMDDSGFSMDDGNILKIQLTAESLIARAGRKEEMTLYTACYPRLASFR